MPLLRRRSVFAAKTETVAGTAVALAAADGAYNARDFMIQPVVAMTRREGQGGFNFYPSIPEALSGTCTVVHDLAYDGLAIPTWASVLLPACGWVATGGVFSPVSQGPGSGGVKTLTIGHYKDGKLAQISGAMGTFVITFETGKVAYITFTFTGKYSIKETDVALIAPVYPTTLPMRFAQGAFTYNAFPLCTAVAAVDAGNTVIMRECVNATDPSGYVSAVVTNRAPIITADPESVLVAQQDRSGIWLASTPNPLSIMVGTAAASITVAAPKAQIENKQQGNRSDLMVDDLTFLATAGPTPDSELTITFAPVV